jgi:N-formylmaleamate deformylase
MVTENPQTTIVRNYRPLSELVPTHWHSGTVQAADGTRIHYTRTGGAKPALLLIHGVQVNGLSWLRTAQALEAEYDVVMPDLRGHGTTGGLENGLSSDVMVQDMMKLISALGLEKPFVVGHSMGADVAGRLAAAYPLRGVVLVDPALRNFAAAMPAGETPPWMQAIIETMQSLKTLPHAERMERGLRLLMPNSPAMHESDYVPFIEGQAQFDSAFFAQVAKLGYLFESPAVIAQIACPILLLTARPLMPGMDIKQGIAAFESHWRDGQHIHFADSGHAIMFEQLARFIAVLQDFFRAH